LLKRVKRRYLALQIETENFPNEKEFMDSVWSAVSRLYGEVGASLTNMSLITFDVDRKLVIIRTSLFTLGIVRASLASITKIAGVDIAVHVLAISGTIKALNAKL
jgi:RNase P/RNase MRP subunit POP5